MSPLSQSSVLDPGKLPLLMGTGKKGGPTSLVRGEEQVTESGGRRIPQVPGPLSRVSSH